MAPIYKTVPVEHNGETQQVKLSFELVNEIELAVGSIYHELMMLNDNKPRPTQYVKMLWPVYREAGFKLTREDVHFIVSTSKDHAYMKIIESILNCALPFQEDVVLPATIEEKKGGKKK
ncbi:MAG: hypothetical protein HGA77_04910 [Chlorobiaceae bacterium]|nr:hypothetical protein [Chlorobiaceae bacterium]